MQGIFINGARPRSKKNIKDAIAQDPSMVRVEATSFFGDEYDGPASEMPEGKTVSFVGPDPYVKHSFYGTISRKGSVVTVK